MRSELNINARLKDGFVLQYLNLYNPKIKNVAVIKSTLKQMPVVNMSKSSNSSKDYMKLCEKALLSVK
ncbi:hypothetical protein [Clostridium yunnanense]|uniref:hypothetical protein n=1 Tax=Clostridium yunnanense TaxID=2800325 RepID=UPI0019030410|nr:hypothetical protein [Clostridium yunnanense]